MTVSDNTNREQIRLYRTGEHPCSYLSGKNARTLFIDPEAGKSSALYQLLIDIGFRRSGHDIYRPDCEGCAACIPARIPVAEFSPRRSQRRVWRQQESMQIKNLPAEFNPEHFELYRTYMDSRHPEGEMANPTEEDYCRFLIADWCETRFVEFRVADKLYAVAVIDLLPDGLSAVYTFFNPKMSEYSPGVLAILWQIQEARRLGLNWVYLGYWVQGCRKMEYKTDYRPVQLFTQGGWKEFSSSEIISIPELSDNTG